MFKEKKSGQIKSGLRENLIQLVVKNIKDLIFICLQQ